MESTLFENIEGVSKNQYVCKVKPHIDINLLSKLNLKYEDIFEIISNSIFKIKSINENTIKIKFFNFYYNYYPIIYELIKHNLNSFPINIDIYILNNSQEVLKIIKIENAIIKNYSPKYTIDFRFEKNKDSFINTLIEFENIIELNIVDHEELINEMI